MKSKSYKSSLLLFTFALAISAQGLGQDRSAGDALFDPSRVIQIEIRLDPKDWHALRVSHPIYAEEGIQVIARGYEYYRGDVVIDGQIVKSVGVRKKGTGSESTARPAFKIKFNEYLKNQVFGGLEMLTLNNLSFDPTKSQQSLVYSFMNKAGAISPRSNLARITVNGEDLGIYGHVESIDKPFIKRHFDNAKGDLYEGQYGADFTTNDFQKLVHKWGPDHNLSEVRTLMEILETPGPVPLLAIEEKIDLDAFITYWASTVLISSADSYPGNANNYYLYRHPNSGRFYFFPWGADAWALPAGTRPEPVPRSVWADAQLCRRLWEFPQIRERYRNEMRRLISEVWNEESLLSDLARIRQLCQDDWPDKRTEKLTAEVSRFISSQRAAVQRELDRPAADWPIPRAEPVLASKKPDRPSMQVEGSFTAVVAESFPTNVAGYFGRGTTTLESIAGDETAKPFTQSGAVAVLKRDRGEKNRIKIAVANAADVRWQIWIDTDPYRAPLQSGAREIGRWSGVECQVIKSNPNSPKNQWRRGTGTLEFTQVSTNLGGMISGRFKIDTAAFAEEKKAP